MYPQSMFCTEAVLTCTHNQCFGAKLRKIVYPCKPQFYYIKVGCKGVFVTWTCFRDGKARLQVFLLGTIAWSVACQLRKRAAPRKTLASGTFFCGKKNPLPLIEEEQVVRY